MAAKRVRFGQFELDFGAFQLFRAGEPVQIEGLPLRLLMYLIEHHRDLVTREEIANLLWGKDVFVDFEMGINTAIRKIRIALEDDSAQPQYLQTVVGQGYRLVAQINPIDEIPASPDSAKVSLEELGQAIMAAAGLDPETRMLNQNFQKSPDTFLHDDQGKRAAREDGPLPKQIRTQ